MKKSYLYVSLLGFNVLVMIATFLIWNYFSASHVSIDLVDTPRDKITNIGHHPIMIYSVPWLNNTLRQYETLSEKCDTSLAGCHIYETLPVLNYELNSLIETLHLTKINDKPFGFFAYNYTGWVEYNQSNHQVYVTIFGYYENYIFYGIVASVVGTLVITLIWKKLQNRQSNIHDSTHH